MSSLSNVKNVVDHPIKNMLHHDPEIYTIDNILSADECQQIIDIAKPSMKRSLVSCDKQGTTSQRIFQA